MDKKLKILAVDDDSTFLFILRKQIEKTQTFEIVKEAKHGEEALEYIKTQFENKAELPDIVLLDINMPVMSGWQFLDEFVEFSKSGKFQIPVCMLSSTINQLDFDKSKTYSQVRHMFSKPLTPQHIDQIRELYGNGLSDNPSM